MFCHPDRADAQRSPVGAGERRAAFVKLAVPGALNGDGVARENLRAQIVDQ